jgi:hypothetical protein
MFDPRESAIWIWTTAFILFAVSLRSVRPSVIDIIKHVFKWKVAVPFLLYFALVGAVIELANLVGLMSSKLLGSTILWVAFSGVALLFKLGDVLAGKPVFKREVVGTFGFATILALFLNAKTFALPWELLVVAFITVATALRAVAEHAADTKVVARFIDILISIFVIWLLWISISEMVHLGTEFDWPGLISGFVMPIVLTIISLAYLFVVSCYAAYESLIVRLKVISGHETIRVKPIIGVIAVLGARPAVVNKMSGRARHDLQEATTVRQGFDAAKTYLEECREKRRKEQQKLDDLTKYAGVDGSDSEGRRYDRREFRETKTALEWLGTCHMGWYRQRDGSYDPDLIARITGLFDNYGLPADHGVHMEVSADGQSWYGFRRTAAGWVFGIGANGPPPSQVYFDGPEPPKTFPGEASEWSGALRSPNWQTDD